MHCAAPWCPCLVCVILNACVSPPGSAGDVLEEDPVGRLKVFVYTLPPKYNTKWLDKDSRCLTHMFATEIFVHEFLKISPVRTLNPEEADWFYTPVYTTCDLTPSGLPLPFKSPRMMRSAIDYISKQWPYWNRTEGADHFFVVPHDFGACFHYQVLFFCFGSHTMYTIEPKRISLGRFVDSVSSVVLRPTFKSGWMTGVRVDVKQNTDSPVAHLCRSLQEQKAIERGIHPLLRRATLVQTFGQSYHVCLKEGSIVVPPYAPPQRIQSRLIPPSIPRSIFVYFRGLFYDYGNDPGGGYYAR